MDVPNIKRNDFQVCRWFGIDGLVAGGGGTDEPEELVLGERKEMAGEGIWY